ncbi:MAG TPA: CoA-binding protein [Acidimicrobiales bacterium]|nr:CoA-binding protein [Acidimicrobiales bacterium]
MSAPIDPEAARSFFALDRIALVGASDDKKHFSNAVFLALRDHGVHAIPVNPHETVVGGETCYPDIATVPGAVDGVIVMVNHETALQIVDECIERGVTHVWLFKGLGGDSAVSDEAVARCRNHDIHVIPGACPMMFLQPVKGFHRFHRGIRRLRRDIGKAA